MPDTWRERGLKTAASAKSYDIKGVFSLITCTNDRFLDAFLLNFQLLTTVCHVFPVCSHLLCTRVQTDSIWKN